MKCHRCRNEMAPGDSREFQGQAICEDCYMVALSPPKACDPWAVYSAKSFSEKNRSGHALTQTQSKIIDCLKETGGADLSQLSEKLSIRPPELEKEIATLRHMELARAEMRAGTKVICLW